MAIDLASGCLATRKTRYFSWGSGGREGGMERQRKHKSIHVYTCTCTQPHHMLEVHVHVHVYTSYICRHFIYIIIHCMYMYMYIHMYNVYTYTYMHYYTCTCTNLCSRCSGSPEWRWILNTISSLVLEPVLVPEIHVSQGSGIDPSEDWTMGTLWITQC